MKRTTLLALGTAALLTCGATTAQADASGQAGAGRSAANTQQGLQQLQQQADQLRNAIQAMSGKAPGPERDQAVLQAHQALVRTQQAMYALPPQLRGAGPMTQLDDQSVRQLMASANDLSDSIRRVSQQAGGPQRQEALQQAQRALQETQVALVNAYGATSVHARTMGAAPAGRNAPEGAALLIMPVQVATDAKLGNGCWVRFYDDKNFKGDMLTLVGPVDMAKMEVPGGAWKDWDSAVTGPRATVVTFDNENFRDRTARLAPNQKITDLRDKKLGWFDEVKSARVQCAT